VRPQSPPESPSEKPAETPSPAPSMFTNRRVYLLEALRNSPHSRCCSSADCAISNPEALSLKLTPSEPASTSTKRSPKPSSASQAWERCGLFAFGSRPAGVPRLYCPQTQPGFRRKRLIRCDRDTNARKDAIPHERGLMPVPPSDFFCKPVADPKARFCCPSPANRHPSTGSPPSC
jgi:hypothetical protein